MEARPFSIRGVLWGVVDNLVHLYPLLLLGGLLIEVPLAALSDLIYPTWSSALGDEDDAWRYPTPVVVLAGFYPALVALAVWNRTLSKDVNLRRILQSTRSIAVPLGAWMIVYHTAMSAFWLGLAQVDGNETFILVVALSILLSWVIALMLVIPLIVIESQGAVAAAARSIRLVRLKLPQVIALALVIAGLTGLVEVFTPTLLVDFFVDKIIDWGYRGEWDLIIWASRILRAIAPPIWPLTAAVLYVALRRHEDWLQTKQEEGAETPSST